MSVYSDLGLTATSGAGTAGASTTKKPNDALGQEEFLSLLTTQLSYQDPSNPVDNSQMVTQLAQMNMVSGIASLNDTATSLSNSVTSSQALMASSLVGQEVQLSGNTGYFDGVEASQFAIKAGEGAQDMVLNITDANGSLINSIKIGDGSGDINLYWDGTDSTGAKAKPGNYSYSVSGRVNGTSSTVPVYAYAKVSSVSLGQGLDGTVLNLLGGGTLKMNEVKNIGGI